MQYEMKFNEILDNTKKGFILGAVLSLALTIFLMHDSWSWDGAIEVYLCLLIISGGAASIVISYKTGTEIFMNQGISRVCHGAFTMLLFSDLSGMGFIFGLVRLCIGVMILIPVFLYMSIAYVMNLIYLTIMWQLEKRDMLAEKQQLCSILDKAVPLTAFLIVAVICVNLLKA